MNLRATIRVTVISGTVLLGFILSRQPIASSAAPTNASGTPVLVELFTSEGCSDCPPADVLLSKLAKMQPVPGANIIILEEHVTYWDQYGWKDPFSFRAITSRQANYADAFGGQQVYTPQMIVDGQAAFVGSSASKANFAILGAAASHKAAVTLQWMPDGKLKVDVAPLSEIGSREKADIFIAVTEDSLHSDVSRGENAGHSFVHDGVVRQLERVGEIDGAAKPFSSAFSVPTASSWNRANLHVVVFVQDQQRLRVMAAAQIPFSAS